jgi:plastocyanin
VIYFFYLLKKGFHLKKSYQGLVVAAILILCPLACNQSFNSAAPAVQAVATATLTPSGPVTVTLSAISASGSFRYSIASSGVAISAPITISVGSAVTWDTSNNGIHPLYIDNGSGTCSVSANTSFPFTQTFSTTGDYTFHCGNHGTCTGGGSVCTLPCSAMTGVVHVQ